MDAGKVRSLVKEILALPDAERQELAREVLPTLMPTFWKALVTPL